MGKYLTFIALFIWVMSTLIIILSVFPFLILWASEYIEEWFLIGQSLSDKMI